jgi:hypothetical protein
MKPGCLCGRCGDAAADAAGPWAGAMAALLASLRPAGVEFVLIAVGTVPDGGSEVVTVGRAAISGSVARDQLLMLIQATADATPVNTVPGKGARA